VPPLSADADKWDQDNVIYYRTAGNCGPFDQGDNVNALNAQSGDTGKGDAAPCVAFKPAYFSRGNKTSGAPDEELCHSLTSSPKAGDTAATIQQGYAVRRLTPKECCRLQGFPDDYLDIQFKGKPATDGHKYRALGNSMAVPVIRYLGERIAAVSKLPIDETSVR
jgi:DNA (cytosine-5)-methyltransferase 1